MNYLIKYSITFRQLTIQIKAEDCYFNLEMKSNQQVMTLPQDMKIMEQFPQVMEATAILRRSNSKFEDKWRKISVILKKGQLRKVAGFITFDLAYIVNQHQQKVPLDKQLKQSPDNKATLSITITINGIDRSQLETDSISTPIVSISDFNSDQSSQNGMGQLTKQLNNLKYRNQDQQCQIKFLESQNGILQKEKIELQKTIDQLYEEKQILDEKIDQLYDLNVKCIDKIRFFEKLVEDLKSQLFNKSQ